MCLGEKFSEMQTSQPSQQNGSMNSNELPIYNSTGQLSNRIYDYANVYLLPAICAFGMVTSFINILIFSKAKLWKEKVFIYMLVNSISDFLFLFIEFFLVIIRCGTLCPWGYSYFAKFYEIYFYLHLGYALVVFTALIDISVSLERLNIVTASKYSRSGKRPDLFNLGLRVNTKQRLAITCVLFFLVANILVLPCFFLSREVTPLGRLASYGDDGSVTYTTLYTKDTKLAWRQDDALKVIFSLFTIAKGPFLLALLFFVNIMVIVRLKEAHDPMYRLNSRQEVKANKATHMIIIACLTYLVGNTLDSIAPLMVIFGIDLNRKYSTYLMISNVFFFLSHGVSLFIYYAFNKEYRNLFQQTFCFKKAAATKDEAEAKKQAHNSSFTVFSVSNHVVSEHFSLAPRQ